MESELEKKLNDLLSLYDNSTIILKNGQSLPFDTSSLKGLIYRAILDIEKVSIENKKLVMQNQIRQSGNFTHTIHDFIKDIKDPEKFKKFKEDLLKLKQEFDPSQNKKV